MSPYYAVGSTRASRGVALVDLGPRPTLGKAEQQVFVSAVQSALGAQAVTLDSAAEGGPVALSSCGQAPLCAFDDALVVAGNFSLAVPLVQMGPCCTLQDTQPTAPCQVIDPSQPFCRVTELANPFCDVGSDPDSSECQALTDPNAQVNLTIMYGYDADAAGGRVIDSCCATCACYGDPHCSSFSGAQRDWIVCDMHDPSNDCKQTAAFCRTQPDGSGGNCVYKPPGWLSFWESGSQCQPNPLSRPLLMSMYTQGTDLQVQVRQGERGTIRAVNITTSSGVYSLDASKCVSGTNFANSWTYAGPGEDLQLLSGWKRVKNPGRRRHHVAGWRAREWALHDSGVHGHEEGRQVRQLPHQRARADRTQRDGVRRWRLLFH
jgi:hypothetical protein